MSTVSGRWGNSAAITATIILLIPHCMQILHQLSHQGSPRIREWVAYSFSSRSSLPRNQTGVSYIAGGPLYQLSYQGRHIYLFVPQTLYGMLILNTGLDLFCQSHPTPANLGE